MYHMPQGFILSCQSNRLPSFIFSMPPLKWFESAVLSCSDTNLTWGSAGCFFAHNFLRILPSIYTHLFIEESSTLYTPLFNSIYTPLFNSIYTPLFKSSLYPTTCRAPKSPQGSACQKPLPPNSSLAKKTSISSFLGSNPQLKTTSIL